LKTSLEEVADRIFTHGRAEAVVAMAGAAGSRLVVRGSEPEQVPAVVLPDRPVVDSNGAGDAYVAAFLAIRLSGGSWSEAASAGAVAGAWACGSAGTYTEQISAEELRRHL
jgi:sugar/nucleoside kinase (ribokinase family)